MIFSPLAALAVVGLVAAHPGADHHQELRERSDFLSKVERRDLSHCAEYRAARGIEKRAMARRKQTRALKSKRGLIERAPEDINKSHHSSADYTANTPLDVIFGSNTSCVLSPEVTEGPYYVSGEYIRQDITDNEAGVPLIVDLDVFDVETCEPIPDLYVEIWSCNSTGVYSGVPSGGDYTEAPENLNTTFLRGFQKTDDIGAVQFDSIYPGHYSGRTHHIHVMVHPNATARSNGTIVDTISSHVGQVYFDQELSNAVEELAPYNTNTQSLTLNADDFLLASGLETSDPFMNYVLLGESVSEGVLAWISFGINSTYVRTVSAAATYYEGGGVSNGDSGGGGPGGPGGPSGTPSGTVLPPSGTPSA
ncbi:unnamed protein product [Clonostachys rosea]|uniref:Intradiol ring-cleavage dioxygenases domain-containing protein n=1 Tax=Bionectria ochroleuca TaxID=29856 RepID=A0ABY6U8T6_BIOOC|nr:unnamed protein product [Clonostachys rosea]